MGFQTVAIARGADKEKVRTGRSVDQAVRKAFLDGDGGAVLGGVTITTGKVPVDCDRVFS